MYPNQKCILLLLIILRYPIDKHIQEVNRFESHIFNDIKNCPKCFKNLSDFCKRVQLDYELDDDFTNNFNNLFGVRQNRVLSDTKNSNNKIISKYLARDFDFSIINGQTNESEVVKRLSQIFLNESRLDGMQYCPTSRVKRFVKFFKNNYTEINIWMHMNVNIQPIILPYLHSLGFPVPKTYASCGFTLFQSVDGIPLANLYASSFIMKLKIAILMLNGALKFSEGFDSFQIYITDLSIDNVVYSQKENELSFVDLDTVLIVDVSQNPKQIHKHEFFDCYDCFAFSPSEICAGDKSDMNIFAVCQLLRENLKRDRTKGFLYPIPDKFVQLKNMLSECVDCKDITCENRFGVANEMIKKMKEIIKNNS